LYNQSNYSENPNERASERARDIILRGSQAGKQKQEEGGENEAKEIAKMMTFFRLPTAFFLFFFTLRTIVL
jgi:hypothetical protein